MRKRKKTPTRFIAAEKLLRSYHVTEQKPLPLSLVERYQSIGPGALPYLIKIGLVFRDPIPRIRELPEGTALKLSKIPGLKSQKGVLSALKKRTLCWVQHGNRSGTFFKGKRISQLGGVQFRAICAWVGYWPRNQFPPFH